MKKIIPPSLYLLTLNYVHAGLDRLSLTCAMGLSLTDGSLLDPSKVYASAVEALKPYQSQGLVLDRGINKVRGEVLLAGRAYRRLPDPAQRSESLETLEPILVSIKVGPIARDFLVTAQEYENSGPVPFQSSPLDWAHTLYDEKLNPYGIKPGQSRDLEGILTAPRVYGFIPSPSGGRGRVLRGPACPLPRPLTTEGLSDFGTFDEFWTAKYWPGFPPDFDYSYFNLAQNEQTLAGGFFQGREDIVIKNAHPRMSLAANLPGLRLRLILRRQENNSLTLSEAIPNLDTVWLFPETQCALILWHASIETVNEKASDVETILAALEPMDCSPLGGAVLLAQAEEVTVIEPPLPPPAASEPALEAKAPELTVPEVPLKADFKLPQVPPPPPVPSMAEVGQKAKDILKKSWPEVETALKAAGITGLTAADVEGEIDKGTRIYEQLNKAPVLSEEQLVSKSLLDKGFSPQEAADIQKAATLPLPKREDFENSGAFEDALKGYGQTWASLLKLPPQAGADFSQKLSGAFSNDPLAKATALFGAPMAAAMLRPAPAGAIANPGGVDWAAMGFSTAQGQKIVDSVEQLETVTQAQGDLGWAEKKAGLLALAPGLDEALGLKPGTMSEKMQKSSQDFKTLAWGGDDVGAQLDNLAMDPQHGELAGVLPKLHKLRKNPPLEADSLADVALMAGLNNPKILALIGTLDFLNPLPPAPLPTPPKEPPKIQSPPPPPPNQEPAAPTASGPAVLTTRQMVIDYLLDPKNSLAGLSLAGLPLGGLNFSGRDLSGADLRLADLTGSDFSGACLKEAVLSESVLLNSNLTGADLTGAVLLGVLFGAAQIKGADFSHSVLTGADLAGCDLQGLTAKEAYFGGTLLNARLKGSDLTGAVFQKISLIGSDFTGAKLDGASFTDADLAGAVFKNAFLAKGSFENCNLSGADFSGAQAAGLRLMASGDLGEADFTGADLSGFLLFQTQARGTKFIGVKASKAQVGSTVLDGSNWSGSYLREAVFFASSLKGALLTGADLFKAVLGGADLSGADFSGSSLYAADFYRAVTDKGTNFFGSDLTQTLLIRP